MTAFGERREVDPRLKPDDRWDLQYEKAMLWKRTTNLQAQIRAMSRRIEWLEEEVGL